MLALKLVEVIFKALTAGVWHVFSTGVGTVRHVVGYSDELVMPKGSKYYLLRHPIAKTLK